MGKTGRGLEKEKGGVGGVEKTFPPAREGRPGDGIFFLRTVGGGNGPYREKGGENGAPA